MLNLSNAFRNGAMVCMLLAIFAYIIFMACGASASDYEMTEILAVGVISASLGIILSGLFKILAEWNSR